MRSFSFAFFASSIVLASTSLAGCGDASEPATQTGAAPACKPGAAVVDAPVDRSKQLVALTPDERAALCEARPASVPELPCTCPDGRPSEYRVQTQTKEECVASIPSASCTATVDDLLGCMAIVNASPCDLARASEDPRCRAVAACVED